MSRQKFWRQIRLPRKAGEANLPDKIYGQELSLSSYVLSNAVVRCNAFIAQYGRTEYTNRFCTLA